VETKREGQRKAKRRTADRNQKKNEGELVPPVVGGYLTHSLSNVLVWSLTLKCMNK
jgi:hypothetical protein